MLVARRPSGESRTYAPALNHHVKGILEWSVLPGPLPHPVANTAESIARDIAVALGVEGLLVVEFFLTRAGELLVNELAPRPHNTFHTTEVACATSQFEQLTRAVCDLPLGLDGDPPAGGDREPPRRPVGGRALRRPSTGRWRFPGCRSTSTASASPVRAGRWGTSRPSARRPTRR